MIFDGVFLMALCDFDGNDPAVEDDGHGSAAKRLAASVFVSAGRWNSFLFRQRRPFDRKWRWSVRHSSQNPGRLRPGRHGDHGTSHAKDAHRPQQREDDLVFHFLVLHHQNQSNQRQQFDRIVVFVVVVVDNSTVVIVFGRLIQQQQQHQCQGTVVQRKTEKRVACRPSDSGKCRLFVAVVDQSDGRRSQSSHPIPSSSRHAGLVGRRAFRLPSGSGRRFFSPARHRCTSPTRTRRFFLPSELQVSVVLFVLFVFFFSSFLSS